MKNKIDVELNVTLLKLRNAIAQKEFITASANAELAWYEKWQCDWSITIRELNEEIARIVQLQADK